MVAAELLARADCTVVGLDQSARDARRAPARASPPARTPSAWSWSPGRPSACRSRTRRFDALTFTYLLRYVDDPPATMRELARVLRPGARIASLEFGVPARARAARWHGACTRPSACRRSGALYSREWYEVGRFLGPSIAGFYARHPLPAIVEYWQRAGLRDVRVRRMSLGGGVVMSARAADAG